jgi:hypothetical protein
MSGFITFRREAMDHPLFQGDAQRLGAWLWLVARAAWKPTPFNVAGRIITLERGQLCASRSQMAKAWGMSESSVERFLTRLQTERMIGRETGQGKSVVTICNYSKYQDISDDAGQASGPATGQRPDSDRTAKEQGNKGTIEEEEARASPSSARAKKPDPFPMPEWADPQVWSDFLANRRKKSRPNTATAHKRMLTDIAKLANDEWPPGRLLEHAAARGWAGIYDPRENLNGNRDRTAPDRRDHRSSIAKAADAFFGDGSGQQTDPIDRPGTGPAGSIRNITPPRLAVV